MTRSRNLSPVALVSVVVSSCCLVLVAMLLPTSEAWQPTGGALERRIFMAGLVGGVVAGSSAPAHAVIGSGKLCISGVGEGCADLAEGNPFIQSLQEKSASKKEQYAKVK
jgi:hypothetical protein